MYEQVTMVPVSMCGSSGKMNLATVTAMFQDVVSYDDFGYNFKKRNECKFLWLLVSWRINVARFPECEETIKIRTYLNSFEGFFSIRTFSMLDMKGNIIVTGTANYAFCSKETDRISRIPKNIVEDHITEEYKTCQILPFGNRTDYNATEHFNDIQIMRHDVDINCHTNNISYIRMALDLMPVDQQPTFLEIYYEKPSYYGDVLQAYKTEDGGKTVIQLKKEDITVATVIFGND